MISLSLTRVPCSSVTFSYGAHMGDSGLNLFASTEQQTQNTLDSGICLFRKCKNVVCVYNTVVLCFVSVFLSHIRFGC